MIGLDNFIVRSRIQVYSTDYEESKDGDGKRTRSLSLLALCVALAALH